MGVWGGRWNLWLFVKLNVDCPFPGKVKHAETKTAFEGS